MFSHDEDSANRHHDCQVPNGPLNENGNMMQLSAMADDFRRAFLRHIEEHSTPLTALSRATGVSLDVLKKLKTRGAGSTTVENGLLIAAYYGETVNQFVAMDQVTDRQKLNNLFELMTPSERQLLEAQMLGLIAARGRR